VWLSNLFIIDPEDRRNELNKCKPQIQRLKQKLI